jgi:Protein of unknown function (DUF3365)
MAGMRQDKALAGAAGRALAGALLLASGLAACAPKVMKPDPVDLTAARQSALLLEVAIRNQLLDRLERDEAPAAVYTAYRDEVRVITGDIAKKAGVDLKRVSERVRNPANAADDWERKQLALFQYWLDAGLDEHTLEVSEIVTEGKVKYFRWMRPITMGETCITCHGDKIEPKLLTLLVHDFPDDEATGYFEGELAGAYSVKKEIK